jgi:nicotinamidase-related amidase
MAQMNGTTIPDSIIQRVIQRRGTAHCYAELEPRRTALVVIDLQNGYMHPDGGYSNVAAARDIVPNVNRLAAALREAGGGVFWVQNTDEPGCRESWSVQDEMLLPAVRDTRIAAMTPGSFGHRLWDGLDVQDTDAVIEKYRYSAFLPGASKLPELLRVCGVDTVLITGTMTNVCCESSARDAMMTNFRTIMVSDGNAASTQAEHDAALSAFYRTFGDVQDTDMLIEALQRRTAQAA